METWNTTESKFYHVILFITYDHYISVYQTQMLFVIPAEFAELQQHLQEYQVLRYVPPAVVKQTYKDGGVAIIEQIICSHARYHMCYIVDQACPTCSCPQSHQLSPICMPDCEGCCIVTLWTAELLLYLQLFNLQYSQCCNIVLELKINCIMNAPH